tara:strand:- start:242 stop:1156 length:915 start_codon:yes stop_codon:yes gene_type:complete
VIKSKFLTSIFQNYLISKDIRSYKGSLIYYLIFRIIRNFLAHDIVLNIYNFKVFGSVKKNKTSYFLLKKCDFGDYHELDTIRKISRHNKIIFLDCGCNYGFYSFYVASLSSKNVIFSIEASKKTSEQFLRNLELNKFSNITFYNKAISNIDNNNIFFNESENDWESSQTHKNFKLSTTSEIKSIKIDTLLRPPKYENYKVIIKLDIEGNEMGAIDGALKIIQDTTPLIIIEFSKYIFDKEKNVKYLKNFLVRNDYSIYDTNKLKINLNDVILKINSLGRGYDTIGNYYLIKNKSKTLEEFLLNE